MTGREWIGTSGWNYKAWSGGVFYPPELKVSGWLDHYSKHFNSVEVNNTFYHLPKRNLFEAWQRQTPDNFVFTLKVSRFITHMKKLLDPAEHVSLFLERAQGLGPKLKSLLFQLPPFWNFNGERLGGLCDFMTRQQVVPGVRVALEVRNPTWLVEPCFDILRAHNVALALTDFPSARVSAPITADFVFVRRHGPQGLYSSDYSEEMLAQDAERIRAWIAQGRDVYEYFNNDVQGFAVKNATRLRELAESTWAQQKPRPQTSAK